MGEVLWAWKVVVIVFAVTSLAYLVPGMFLRAINDFLKRYGKGKGEADGKT